MSNNQIVVLYTHETLTKTSPQMVRTGEIVLLALYEDKVQIDHDFLVREYGELFPGKLEAYRDSYLRFLNKDQMLGFTTKVIKQGDQKELVLLDSMAFNRALEQSDRLSQLWDNMLKSGEILAPSQAPKGLWDRLF